MRVILNFLLALDRISGLMVRPLVFILLVELVMVFINLKGFNLPHDMCLLFL